MKKKPLMNQEKTYHSDYNNPSKINSLCWRAVEYIDEIYEYFDFDVSYKNEDIIKSNCYIHGGDNRTACNLYPNGNEVVHWKCRTHGCEEHFGAGLIGFIKGCLSKHKYNWNKIGDKEASFNECVDFLLKITNQNFDALDEESHENIEKKRFSKMVWTLLGNEEDKPLDLITREHYVSHIEIPAQYYLDRGYSKEILTKYDVGFCNIPGKQMHNRAIVPIYDENHIYAVGFTGRSVFSQCKKCKFYHDPQERCKFFPKWRHSKGFIKEKFVYNYWYAKEFISQSRVVVLVESPGNVWKLEEAGIHNSLGIFGTALNQGQRELLDKLGVMTVILLMDNDKAGYDAAQKIIHEYSNFYRIHNLSLPAKDLEDMSSENIYNFINPYIQDSINFYTGHNV